MIISAPVVRAPREGGPEINNADDLLNHLLDFATDIFKATGEVRPMLMILGKENVEFASVQNFMDSDDTKNVFRSVVTQKCSDPDVEGIGLAMECWTVMDRSGVDTSIQPSKHPDREEVVMVYAEWKDCTTREIALPIIREEKKTPRFGEPVKYEFSAGRMRNFFPRKKESLH
jgi:hypothetical protein